MDSELQANCHICDQRGRGEDFDIVTYLLSILKEILVLVGDVNPRDAMSHSGLDRTLVLKAYLKAPSPARSIANADERPGSEVTTLS